MNGASNQGTLEMDCGPMSGFDNAKLDEEFFAAVKCEPCEQEFSLKDM
jgi:3-hydroxypropanoate dehydrogenase